MRGELIWFNDEKGHGFIRTEEDERLQVDRHGFAAGQVPVGRCGGTAVQFEVEEHDGERRAVGVAVVADDPNARRARRRRSSMG